MKMEQTECSETSAYKIQPPGNYPEESIQHSEHSESFKSRMVSVYRRLGADRWSHLQRSGSTFFLDSLTVKVGTDRLSRNVGRSTTNLLCKHHRTAKAHFMECTDRQTDRPTVSALSHDFIYFSKLKDFRKRLIKYEIRTRIFYLFKKLFLPPNIQTATVSKEAPCWWEISFTLSDVKRKLQTVKIKRPNIKLRKNLFIFSPAVTPATPDDRYCTTSWSVYSQFFEKKAPTDLIRNKDGKEWRSVVTIYTASLTFNNSTFCQHTVFMCFLWIWKQIKFISLYNFNWLVFIREREREFTARYGLNIYT